MNHKLKMIQVGKRLDEDNIANIKYVFAKDIGEGVDKIRNGFEMIKELERIGYVGENNYKDFNSLLNTLSRGDLVSIINGEYEPELDKVDNHELTPSLIDEVANKIANDWRVFGRHLKLAECRLEHIDVDFKKVSEKSVKVLKEWVEREKKKKYLTWCNLKKELESFERHDIVKEIQAEYMHEEDNAYNNKMTPDLIDMVASKIAPNWRDLGLHLNLDQSDLDHIDVDIKKDNEKAYTVLKRCKQKLKGGFLTWHYLKKELEVLGCTDIITELQAKFEKEINNTIELH